MKELMDAIEKWEVKRNDWENLTAGQWTSGWHGAYLAYLELRDLILKEARNERNKG